METFKQLQQEFEETLGNLDLGHGMTWTDKGETIPSNWIFYAWRSTAFPFDYFIVVYLMTNGQILVNYAYPSGDSGSELFNLGQFDNAKQLVLNYFDNTEREED